MIDLQGQQKAPGPRRETVRLIMRFLIVLPKSKYSLVQ